MPFIKTLLIAVMLCTPLSVSAVTLQTDASFAIVVDDTTDTVLFKKNVDEPMAPASMSKLMTVYMVLEQVKKGVLSLDDTFRVSTKAWKKGGSKTFVKEGDRVRVEDLLRGIIVQSGNDACIVIAEGMEGSEEAFAEVMTIKAKEIGLKNSTFANATGWPHPDHRMSSHDLAILASKLINDFPEYYPIFAEKSFTYSGIRQGNRNLLLNRNAMFDGLKTGHTEESGYGLVASAIKDGRRIITVVNGLGSERARADEAERLTNYGFRHFKNVQLFQKGETVEHAETWYGEEEKVPLVLGQDLTLTIPKLADMPLKVAVTYNGPIQAPIKYGTHIANLNVIRDNIEPVVIPLFAGKDVERLSWFGRLLKNIGYRAGLG